MLGHRGLRFVEQRPNQAVGQSVGHAPRRTLGGLPAGPIIEPSLGLATEVAGGDQFGEALGRVCIRVEHLADGETNVEPYGVGELDRTHRHAEGQRRFVDSLRGDPFVYTAHRFHEIGRENAVDQESRRAFNREGEFVDLTRKRGCLRHETRQGVGA